MCFGWITGAGIAMLALLTVPCGMVRINTNKKLWYSRQALVLFIAIILVVCGNYV